MVASYARAARARARRAFRIRILRVGLAATGGVKALGAGVMYIGGAMLRKSDGGSVVS
ncbi:MAG TPA: hypothetical protein VGF16_03755 [Bryobacteraceae bacterium]|jgi:hypothetical protein